MVILRVLTVDSTLCGMPPIRIPASCPSLKMALAIQPGFYRHLKKSKSGVLVAHEDRLMDSKNILERTNEISFCVTK